MEKTDQNQNYYYDAFISYSHVEKDSRLAGKLHSRLEHYRIPKKIQKLSGKKKIRRVFRDQEELPLSSDLSGNIKKALETSEYLIVLCSPESLASKWVQREVAYFLELHGRERILAVLVNGEPETAFPSILCTEEKKIIHENGEETIVTVEVEPLAADMRGNSTGESEKKLKQELLRLLAPMLSCTYDDLRQRHREYRIKKVAAVLSVIFILLTGFAGYALSQNMKIKEQYQQARRNQARYLCEISGNLLDTGDRIGALKTAMAITPENEKDDQPVVPEQMYALNNALYSYQHSTNYKYYPDTALKLEGITTKKNVLSPDGNIFFSIDSSGKVYFFKVNQTQLIWAAMPEDFKYGEEGFIWGEFLSDSQILLASENYFYVLDIEKKSCEKVLDSAKTNFEGQAYSISDRLLAVTYDEDNRIFLYSLEENKPVNVLETEVDFYKNIVKIAFSPDGKYLALGTEDNWENDGTNLFLMEVKTGKEIRSLSCDSIREMCFIGDRELAVIQKSVADPYNIMYFDSYYRATVYNINTGGILWESEKQRHTTQFDITELGICNAGEFIVNENPTPICVFYIKDTFMVVGKEEWKTLHQVDFEENIIGTAKINDRNLMVGLDNGTVYRTMLVAEMEMFSVNSGIVGVYYDPASESVIQAEEDTHALIISRNMVDDGMKCIGDELPFEKKGELPEEGEKNKVFGKERSVTAVCNGESIEVTEKAGEEVLLTIPVDFSDYVLFDFFQHDTKLIIYDGRSRVSIWDIETKKCLADHYLGTDLYAKTELKIDEEGRYFSVNTGAGMLGLTGKGTQARRLDVFYIDEDIQIYPYASVYYGDIDFEKKEIYCFSQKEQMYYAAPLYTYRELIEKAENVAGNFEMTETEQKEYFLQ